MNIFEPNRFQWFLSFSLAVCSAQLCRDNGFTLVRKDFIFPKIIFCSQVQDTSILTKLIAILENDSVFGIYRRNDEAAQVCYWKQVESGLVDLTTLSGGELFVLQGSFVTLFLVIV